jgi:hypothetical protein
MDPSSYSVGTRVYRGTSSAPNIGPVDKTGYAERDRKHRTRMRNQALLKRVQAKQQKRYMSSDYLSSPEGRTV